MKEEEVILVDKEDNPIGTMGKMEAHKIGALHRAFSIFIFNEQGEMLLQQRAHSKYHSPGKWTNSCCSHPRMSESTIQAAQRRLQEEMGMECDLKHGFTFTYRAEFENGLTEHEIDHVYYGITNAEPVINNQEVASFEYKDVETVKQEMLSDPDKFTPWFRICFDKVVQTFPFNRG